MNKNVFIMLQNITNFKNELSIHQLILKHNSLLTNLFLKNLNDSKLFTSIQKVCTFIY